MQFTPVLALCDPFGVDVPLNFDNTHSLTRVLRPLLSDFPLLSYVTIFVVVPTLSQLTRSVTQVVIFVINRPPGLSQKTDHF